MKKAIIFCYSKHHGNTRKISEAIKNSCGVKLVTIPCGELPDLKGFELVGFSSGIYMSDFAQQMYELLDDLKGLDGRDCFTIYTSGSASDKLDRAFVQKLKSKGANLVGRFNCRGYNTYGLFKLIGGRHKGHPDSKDIETAVLFYKNLISK